MYGIYSVEPLSISSGSAQKIIFSSRPEDATSSSVGPITSSSASERVNMSEFVISE